MENHSASPMDYRPSADFLARYLERIRYSGAVDGSLKSVSALMLQQLQTIPFENIDVQNGKMVSLAPDDIIDKILNNKRGGYCYELNGLFALVLQTLGVPYQLVACRPMVYPVKRPKTHMALIADIDGHRYLLDLGFGSHGVRAPLELSQLECDIHQGDSCFRLQKTNINNAQQHDFILQAKVDAIWQSQYSFNLSTHEFIDFAPANYLNSNHPDTLFVKKLVLLIFTANGKKVMVDNRLRITENGESRELMIDDINAALAEHFNLPNNGLLAPIQTREGRDKA
ncbi:MAG TPA: arylamine N-acetyltransferase [Marinagarivorans sp.]